MKVLFIFVFITSIVFGQTNTREFEIRTDISGIEYRKQIKSVELGTEKMDIKFMREHFYIPYYIPMEFVNKKYSNETIVIWNNENGKKDYTENWTNSYTYDTLSRITEYSYSGCISCSSMPYNYKVTYNLKGQVVELKNTIAEKESFEFKYDENGNIKEMKSLSSNGKIEKIIGALE
ncbi:hypothetical protein [uncultured Aquimarina sp.]|uniref:hypothetical protein n=1 Tax=uncultured Aquimarina sp. TaxID=575652 RepID=UPI00260C09F5|nr:hypothetical protein [uncultured Aquimarina sp.]